MRGDFAKLKKLQKAFAELGTPGSERERKLLGSMRSPLRPAVAQQYKGGPAPASPWSPTKQGKPALQSNKLGNSLKIPRVPGGLRIVWMVKWMEAQHAGHTFAARTGGGNSLFFDERGRAIRMGKLSRSALRRKFVQEIVVGAHRVGRRVLPARPQYPTGGGQLPASWRAAILQGARAGLSEFAQVATR